MTISNKEKVVLLSICSLVADQEVTIEAFKRGFREVEAKWEKTDERIKLVFHDGTYMTFHARDEKGYIEKQTKELVSFFDQVPLDNVELKANILDKLNSFKTITSVAFALNEDQKRTNYIMNTLFMIAKETTSFVLQANMSLYSGDKRLVLSKDGKSEYLIKKPSY